MESVSRELLDRFDLQIKAPFRLRIGEHLHSFQYLAVGYGAA